MAKLILVLATLALFVLLANASIYRTVVEFDQENEASSNPLRCQIQYYQQQELTGCQQWIRKRAQQGRIGYEADDFELTLDVDDENRPYQPPLKTCCNELRQIENFCVCHVLKAAALEAKSQGMHGQQQVKHMFSSARNLPTVCNIPAVGSCKFDATPY